MPLSKIQNGCERPLVIEIDSGLTIALAEAKLVDYARMKYEPETARYNNVITQLEGTVNKTLPFLDPEKAYSANIYSGDPSVNTGTHVRIDSMRVDRSTIYTVNFNPNNGIAINIK